MTRGSSRLRRRLPLVAVFVLPTAFLWAAAAWVESHYRIDPPERLGAEARAAVMAALRGVVDGRPRARPSHPELERELGDSRPVVVSVWHRGVRAARVEGRGKTAADAVLAAAGALAGDEDFAKLSPDERHAARIQVDVVAGRAALLRDIGTLELFAFHPGVDGLGVLVAGDEHLLLPDELIRARLLVSRKPVSAIPDLRVGLDFVRAEQILALRARVTFHAWEMMGRRYFRFRSDSFVEPPGGGTPLPLERGTPPGPELTADSLRRAAIEGGRYLVRHLAENGRYIYEVDLARGRATDPNKPRPYSLPRHAGTTYFLAELYRLTGESFLLEPIERAFGHFADLVEEGGCHGKTPAGAEFSCVHQREDGRSNLGSTALAVVALCEYKRATRSGRFDELTRELGEWILSMQREDGSFAHLYDVRRGERDEQAQLLYFSGEAALALARLHAVYGDRRYIEAAERALDWLIDWYDFFAGGFFFGEEHWTCIAAEAAWPALRHERYRAFCDAYGEFLRDQQMQADDFSDQPDLAGTYGVTPFIIPNNTPVGSRTEAMVSSYVLGQHHGKPSEPLRQQILRSMRYALRQQVRPESDFWVMEKTQAMGAVPASSIDPMVRIDYVQHVGSAMIRSVPLVAPGSGSSSPGSSGTGSSGAGSSSPGSSGSGPSGADPGAAGAGAAGGAGKP